MPNSIFVARPSFISMVAILATFGCATESHRRLDVQDTDASRTVYTGKKYPIVVGNFDNRSGYMQGMFTEGPDRLGSQAKTALIGHLQRTGRFAVMDRDNMAATEREAKFKDKKQRIKAGDFAVTGDVVEFGRRDTGDKQLFGVLGSGKEQTAYSKVTLNVVNVETSEVVFSASGAGEYALSNREVLGFGGKSGYDSTLNGKVLDLAIRQAVDRMVAGLEAGQWVISE